jgi:hypothetical protein
MRSPKGDLFYRPQIQILCAHVFVESSLASIVRTCEVSFPVNRTYVISVYLFVLITVYTKIESIRSISALLLHIPPFFPFCALVWLYTGMLIW